MPLWWEELRVCRRLCDSGFTTKKMVYQWPHATYVPINSQHAIIPKEIAGKSLAVNEDIAFALKILLGKPTDGLKREEQGKIFNPSRIY